MKAAAARGVKRVLRPLSGVVPKALLCAVLLCLVAACGGNSRAPVEDRRGGSGSGREYRVQSGDTLYSISFRYGLDYRRVAAANGLKAPYTIFPGQKIALREAQSTVSRSNTQSSKKTAKKNTRTAVAKSPAPVAASKKTGTAAVKKSSSSAGKTTTTAANKGLWKWPASGKVVRKYSSSVHKGIDIDGRAGDPIVAVAAGKVVYAGTGIVGFGELLIVKHSETYLSAYGHNRRLLVAEGDAVRAGQKIAEKGSTGTDKVKLHFEIRRNGKPIDPLALLPGR